MQARFISGVCVVAMVACSGAARTGASATTATRLVTEETTGVATAKGSITGSRSRDFTIHAEAGETLAVEVVASNPAAYLNVLPPGSKDVAMFIGSTSGNRFQGLAPIAGDYVVRVYLIRSVARRNETSAFTLTASVTGAALVPLHAADDAVIPGTPFHAKATVRCSFPYRHNLGDCEAWVIRYGRDATATVELRAPGFVRRILFVKGKPVSSDATETPRSTRNGDTTTVRIGDDERYELPDSLLMGG